MGTNEAFGGSGSADWDRVRAEWVGLHPDSSGAGPGDGNGDSGGDADAPPGGDSHTESSIPASDVAYDSLVAAIAQALSGEDKDARRPSVPSVPLSVVLPGRGRPRRRGRHWRYWRWGVRGWRWRVIGWPSCDLSGGTWRQRDRCRRGLS